VLLTESLNQVYSVAFPIREGTNHSKAAGEDPRRRSKVAPILARHLKMQLQSVDMSASARGDVFAQDREYIAGSWPLSRTKRSPRILELEYNPEHKYTIHSADTGTPTRANCLCPSVRPNRAQSPITCCGTCCLSLAVRQSPSKICRRAPSREL